PAADRDVRADDVAVDEPLDRAVETEAVEVTAPVVADRRHEPLVVEPEHARLAGGGAVEVAAREERDRAVEVGTEPAQPRTLDDVEVVVRPGGKALGRLGDADQAQRAGGRPGHSGDLAGQLRESLRASSAGRDLPRLRVLPDLRLEPRVGDERDPLAVRGPG